MKDRIRREPFRTRRTRLHRASVEIIPKLGIPDPARFRPLDPSRVESLRERNLRLISELPGRDNLRTRLLDIGGQEVVFFGTEFDLDALLARGRDFSGERVEARVILGPSMCHHSASLDWLASRGRVEIATGYALSDDGLWRQHSWGLQEGRVIESTASRVGYLGFVLADEEAERFARLNLGQHTIAMLRER
jgi:hypothetical protein